MGLTHESTKKGSFSDLDFSKNHDEYVIALAGNPNTGKSTVFNAITGLNQHTGNWPGKTVVNARGKYKHNDNEYLLVDVPGTYSLFASSDEEVVARDFICFGNPDVVAVVTDATCLERNLNLVFQVMELTKNVVLIVNLIDEAEKKKIKIDKKGLEKELGIPVVFTAAREKRGIDELKDIIDDVVSDKYNYSNLELKYDQISEEYISEIKIVIKDYFSSDKLRWFALRTLDADEKFFESMKRYLTIEQLEKLVSIKKEYESKINNEELREYITEENYKKAEEISDKYISESVDKFKRDQKIDDILTSRRYGIPIMLLLLGGVFWITVTGANYPSQLLASMFFFLESKLVDLFIYISAPNWLTESLIYGVFRTLGWVVSVMLPPMAIFFPLFTLLEDLGYLPRVAYNLDHLFKKARAHGKQCLSMCMGFGCNAAGVIGCRIIDSPREKLIAILTNNFVPCNGRFPTLIAIALVFFAVTSNNPVNAVISSLIVTVLVIIGVGVTLIVSYLLSRTILKGIPSTFTLELPPYRRPQIGRVVYTSIIDRTVFVLGRAIVVAVPAGLITWILANIYVGDLSILMHVSNFLDPVAKHIGLDGIILMAFILGLPANEIVVPIILMAYLSTGRLIEFDSISSLREILVTNGWTYLTAMNVMLFSLLHWPCSTVLWTIKKETNSWKWTFAGFMIPTTIAIAVTFITTQIYNIFV